MERLKGFITIMRLPFHTVGLLPLMVGFFLARRNAFHLDPVLVGLSLTIVFLIMLATYTLGDYYDQEVDELSATLDKNRFSGGSQAIQNGLMSVNAVMIVGYASIFLSAFLGLFLYFYFETGPWTIPMGMFGAICGIFYTTPPFHWSRRGIGEFMIFLCYGFLPVAVGYYLVANDFSLDILTHGLPIALTITNVILINEFPDYRADLACDKRTLLVRIGRHRGVILYHILNVTTVLSLFLFFPRLLLVCLPIQVALGLLTGRNIWKNPKRLEFICGGTISLNLLITLLLCLRNL